MTAPLANIASWRNCLSFLAAHGDLFPSVSGLVSSDALAAADRAREESERQAESNKEALEQAQAEARAAISEGREVAERVAQEVKERAEADAAQMLEQARRTIQQEKDQAVQELRGEVADLAILATRQILDEQIDENRSRQIVDDVISRLPDSPN